MAIMAAKINIKSDRVDDFLRGAEILAEATRAEAGCRFYEVYRDKRAPAAFWFIEEWASDEAVAGHFKSKHFKDFGALMSEISDGDVEPVDWERVV
jgi:quinol monooxygenase YgiN